MPLTFLKPKDLVKGAGLSCSFNSKGENIKISLIKQNLEIGKEIDSQKAFENGKSISVDLSLAEAGGLCLFLNGVENEYVIKKIGIAGEEKSFVFSKVENKGHKVTFFEKSEVNENKISFGLTDPEKFILIKYINFSLDHIFSAIYSQDKKEALDKKENKTKKERTIEIRDKKYDDGEISLEKEKPKDESEDLGEEEEQDRDFF